MRGAVNLKVGLGLFLAVGCLAWIVVTGAACESAPQPFTVAGPGIVGNQAPTLTITEPITDVTVGQGDVFRIQWTDTDPDDNATISFQLISVASGAAINWVDGLEENDTTGPDSVRPPTTFLTPDRYNLRGIIDDGVNEPVETFARTTTTAAGPRVVITVVGPGEAPQTIPPVVAVAEPSFDRSVAQDDVLTVVIQPTALAPNPNDPDPIPFDRDSDVELFLILDVDRIATNDDFRNPVPDKIIVLGQQTVPANTTATITIDVVIDVATIPVRPDGEPYFVRATVDDGTNTPVHGYAPGSIRVVRLASATVDLFDIGRILSGARFQGFNPTASLGNVMSSVADFDLDGLDDFVMVAQFGNPQNIGPVGEAYLIYGQAGVRFGGVIPVNSIGATVDGVAFQAPPLRASLVFTPAEQRTNGITDVSFVRDLTGDDRPEILFGLPHVEGALNTMDHDPGDERDFPTPLGCYPDPFVNNVTDQGGDLSFYFGGMAVIVNSQNRDNDGLINANRLNSTVISLEHVGQRPVILDAGGESTTGSLFPRADNESAVNLGNDPREPGRIAGARLIAGGYDDIDAFLLFQGPREGLWGQTVRSIADMNLDGLDELIVSAPLNEVYLDRLLRDFGSLSTQWNSTPFPASITIFPGENYNTTFWREIDDDGGTSQQPTLGGSVGSCPQGNPRILFFPADEFGIFAEAPEDRLGDGQSAGDFNLDGRGDILCGAPLNDLTPAMPDSGAAYVIYGRSPFGEIDLELAGDPVLRAPMLRIRGETPNDQIGWRQATGLDVNGDRIDDVFFSSPRTDFPGPDNIERTTCGGTFNGADVTTATMDEFLGCHADVEAEGDLFTDDPCKAFDFDNDNEITFDDQCVFQCLTGDPDRDPACIVGTGADCCANLVDNGFVGIIFGGKLIDGDRTLSQLATSELPGTIFFGAHAQDRAGFDISSAGDFNQDGFGDILIVAPGEIRTDSAGRDRRGVVYLVFGGTHLTNRQWNLADVGSQQLPGMVFISPFVVGRPNEAAPLSVAFIGDVNDDGFGDIMIGNPKADFIDASFPQGPDATDAATGRRSNAGDAYLIYGNNFDTNRLAP